VQCDSERRADANAKRYAKPHVFTFARSYRFTTPFLNDEGITLFAPAR
jgi:hypothetical protein